jgi:sugar lactone lactonase YvrE
MIETIVSDRATLAEAPLWSPAEGSLYWIDIYANSVYRMHLASGRRDRWDLGSEVGSIGHRRSGGLIVGTRKGVEFLDTQTGAVTFAVDPDAAQPETRLNDGKVDRAGRFWVGSMQSPQHSVGRLFRVLPDLTWSAHERGIAVPNAVAWDPDDRRMYFADTFRAQIWAYDFDADAGTIRNRRVFAQLAPGEGFPDGATVDSEGYLWSARIDGWCVARHAPDGSVDRIVELPVKKATSLTLGGDDLRTLFITTASIRLEPHELEAQPLAGAVLAVRVDVPGVPEPAFAG